MIIGHEHRYVFVQVPNTASSAIGRELCERYGGEPIVSKHSHLAELAEHTDGRYRDYFTFATLRNPLEIMVSRYLKLKMNRDGLYTEPKNRVENGGWITERQRERFRFVQQPNADFPAYFLEFAPRLYENPFFTGILDRFDLVLRHETLDESFRTALDRLGCRAQRDIPPLNVGPAKKRPFAEYYTPETHDRAVASFGPFMRAWGYDFPEAWGNPRPPRPAILQYELGRRAGRFCAQRLGWSPQRSLVARDRVRKGVQRATRRWAPTDLA